MYMHYLVSFELSTCPDHYLINIQQSSRQGDDLHVPEL